MADNYNFIGQVNLAGAQLFPFSKSFTNNGVTFINYDTANSTGLGAAADKQVAWALDAANLQLLAIYSEIAITLETNATDATGGNTITLAAGGLLLWTTGCGLTNPLTNDVTTAYLTKVGSTATTFRLLSIANPAYAA